MTTSQDQQRLDHALERLQNFVDAQLEQELGAVSFGLDAPRSTWTDSEDELQASLQGQDVVRSYGLVDEATERVRELLDRTVRVLTRFAQVSSQHPDGGGVTRVGWTGDMDTAVHGLPGEHVRSVEEGLRERHQHLRLGVMTVAFAVKIGRQLTVPGGVVAALPSVWRFIQRVMAELKTPEATEDPAPTGLARDLITPTPALRSRTSLRERSLVAARPHLQSRAPLSSRSLLSHERIFEPGPAS